MADPGPQWLIWAHQMKTHHSDLARQVQQIAEASARNIEGHSNLAKQVQQNAEAVAHAKLLEEQIKQLTMNHSALQDETKTIHVDLQLLSSNLDEVGKHYDAESSNTSRRVTSLEEQSGTILGFVERSKTQAETMLQRQSQETPEWWMQQARDLTGLKEHQKRQNDDRKDEIDQLRAQFEKLKYAMNKQGNS